MDPLTVITTSLRGLVSAKNLANGLLERLKKNDIPRDEARMTMIEVLDSIQAAQGALIDAKHAVVAMQERVKELTDAHELLARRREHDSVYWLADQNDKEDGPYCPTCWDLTGKAVRPVYRSANDDGTLLLRCGANHANITFRVAQQMCGFYSKPRVADAAHRPKSWRVE